MDISFYAIALFEEITLLLVFLLMSKMFFEDSIVIDKKSVTFLIIIAVFEVIFDALERNTGSKIYDRITKSLVFVSLIVYMRGENKRVLHRVRAFIDTFLTYAMSISLYCSIVFILIKPSLAKDFEFMDTKSFAVMVSVVSIIVCIYLYVELYRKGICLNFKWKERILLIFFSLLICFVSNEIDDSLSSHDIGALPKEYCYLFLLCITVIYIVTPLFMIKNKLSTYYEMGQKHQQEILNLQLQHFEQYKEAQEETRRFRHDMINHLMAIQMLQKEEKQQEANEYVDELLGRVADLSPKVVTGSDMLDCIITSKIETMEQNNISYEIDGVFDQGLNMSPVDICVVFANAMDNAIEALLKVENSRDFYMRLKRTNTYYMVVMQNTINQTDLCKTLINKNRFTTKRNKALHGYGLQNMKNAINKYGGEITTELEEDKFILTILLPIIQ